MNRCLQRVRVHERVTKERLHWSKGSKQRNRSEQVETDNLPTDDVENINSTNKWRNLLLANKLQVVLWGAERILQNDLEAQQSYCN